MRLTRTHTSTYNTPDKDAVYATPWPCNHHKILTRIRATLTGGTDHADH